MTTIPVDREAVADLLKLESGKINHTSDCSTSIAPAQEPGPCDCSMPQRPYQIEHAYCRNCREIRAVAEQFVGESVCKKFTGTDIVCRTCAWICVAIFEPLT
jgi:hypothetical protein